MNDCEASLTIVNAIPEIDRATDWLDQFAARAVLPDEVTSKLQVVLDEVLTNIVTHGLADAPPAGREIRLQLRSGSGQVELAVSDDGPAFDPSAAAPVAVAARIARREGGVGLLFVHALMDEVRFVRHHGRNHLLLCKRLPGH